jgi:hypothetical protein
MQTIGGSLTTGFPSFDGRLREQRESKITSTDAGLSWVSIHSLEMHIRQFVAILSLIQM